MTTSTLIMLNLTSCLAALARAPILTTDQTIIVRRIAETATIMQPLLWPLDTKPSFLFLLPKQKQKRKEEKAASIITQICQHQGDHQSSFFKDLQTYVFTVRKRLDFPIFHCAYKPLSHESPIQFFQSSFLL